jgi:uncharacterized spore protein YtfJ
MDITFGISSRASALETTKGSKEQRGLPVARVDFLGGYQAGLHVARVDFLMLLDGQRLERYVDIKSKERIDELHESIRPYILRCLKGMSKRVGHLKNRLQSKLSSWYFRRNTIARCTRARDS